MTIPVIAVTHLGGTEGMPVLLIGPSLGTSVATLWRDVVTAERAHGVIDAVNGRWWTH